MRFRTGISIIVGLLFSSGIYPARVDAGTLPLNTAIDIALENNNKIRQYNERFEQKRYAEKEALGNFFPTVKIQATYNHLNDPLQIDLEPIREAMIQIQSGNQVEFANTYSLLQGNSALTDAERGALYDQYYGQLDSAIPPFVDTFKNQDYRTASIQVTQPLFTGGKIIAAKRYATAELNTSKEELRQTENGVIQDVINQYMNVLLLKNVVQTRIEALDGMTKHKENAQLLFNEGLIARYDLFRAKVAVSDAERALFDDQSNLSLAMIALKNTLGLDEDLEPEAVSDSLLYRLMDRNLGSFINQAELNQPVLQILNYKGVSAQQNYVAQRADFFPTIAGFAKYEMVPEDLSSLEPRWVAGIQLNYTLFEGFKNKNRLQSAKHIKQEVTYLQQDTKRQIDLWVEKSYRDLRNNETRYIKLKSDIALAKENLRLNEKRFETGLGTSLEVIDANLSLQKSQIERLLSLHNYYQSMSSLYTAAGNPIQLLEFWNSEGVQNEAH
ncbi:MAG: TolC family protein [Calditrichaceae bacterium]